MVDWTKPMQQSFEYYIVDPETWQDQSLLSTVKKSSINRDAETDTLGSATFDIVEKVGECYVRVYLITIQNGVREKHPLGTFLAQTPTSTFDGKTRNVSMDAYTPLIELKEKQPDIGYYEPKTAYHNVLYSDGKYEETEVKIESPLGSPMKESNGKPILTTSGKQVYKQISSSVETTYYCGANSITDRVALLLTDKVRAPIVKTDTTAILESDFVSDINDTWFSFLRDLLIGANHQFDLDEMGRILFVPYRDLDAMQPVWTYNDDNSSILYPEITMDHDIYGIPNVVEIRYYDGQANHVYKVVNDDPNSPTSTVNRGRRIIHRVTDLDIPGALKKDDPLIEAYAKQLLKELSTIEYTITYTHGYCPVRVGDCVRLNYSRAGMTNIKAKVVSQSIKCEPGCSVTEKAIFTNKLWG